MFRVRPANRVPVCQVPRGQPPDKDQDQVGMRHRAGLGLSEETDAVLLVVSEETGRISLAVAGRLEAVPRENLSRRLAELLSPPAATRLPAFSPKKEAA